jgi:hypothetical protein
VEEPLDPLDPVPLPVLVLLHAMMVVSPRTVSAGKIFA